MPRLPLLVPRRGPWGRLGHPLRSLLLVAVALLLVSTTTPPATAAPDQRRARVDADPLQVQLSEITPSALTGDDRPLTVTGTVTNVSAETWSEINLYAFRSLAPITDATSLAASAAIEADAFVGERVVDPGTDDRVDVLAPGDSADFELTVPRDLLTISVPGVYWLGVHASGLSETIPRDDFADGRARTFMPLVEQEGRLATRPSVEAAVVLPIRQAVWLAADGSLARPGRWKDTLSEGGRLDALLDVGEASGATPLTWLVDPAVPTAVARLAAGNPGRSIAPDPEAPAPSEPTGPTESLSLIHI